MDGSGGATKARLWQRGCKGGGTRVRGDVEVVVVGGGGRIRISQGRATTARSRGRITSNPPPQRSGKLLEENLSVSHLAARSQCGFF